MIPTDEIACSQEERAEAYFMRGYNCSQAVFVAFADRYGFTEEMALQMTAPLGAGISAMREVCGAVSAMSLICGLEEGNFEADREKKQACYEANRGNLALFTDRWGSIICRDILKMAAEEKCQAPSERTKEYYAKRPCAAVVRTAARILEERYPEKTDRE